MDDPNALILDISSDEDSGCGSGKDDGGGGGTGAFGRDDYGWISELLDNDDDDGRGRVGGGGDTDDSDDVVVVGEVFANRKQRVKSSSYSVVKGSSNTDENDDDDCIVLDGDPDKPAAIEKDRSGSEVSDDSDDLVVVSEKGQVACRDFPHPRHLCARFPFASTPHQTHCDQCHCYVCDSLAPCVHWGAGISNVDHCHATDKNEFWKAQRKISLRSDKAPPVSSALTDISLLVSPHLTNQEPTFSSNLVLQQVPRRATIRPCSIPRQGRSPHPSLFVTRRKFQPQLISQHLRSAYNHVTLRDRSPNSSNMGPHYISSRAAFKRTGSVGAAFTSSRSSHYSPNNNYGSQLSRDQSSTARWQAFDSGVTSMSNARQASFQSNVGQIANSMASQTELPTQAIPGNGFVNYTCPAQVPTKQDVSSEYANYVSLHSQMASVQHPTSAYMNYEPQVSCRQQVAGAFTNLVPQTFSQPESGNLGNSLPSGPQIGSKPLVGDSFANSMPTQSQVTSLSQQNGGRTSDFSRPSKHPASEQFVAGNTFQTAVPSQSVTASIANMGSTYGSLSSPHQPQEYSQPTSVPNNSENVLLLVNQTQDDSGSTFAAIPSSHELSIGNSQLQNVEPADHPLVNTELYSHFSSFAEFSPSDLHFENWFFEHGSVPEAPGCSVPSPEPVHGGLFSDF